MCPHCCCQGAAAVPGAAAAAGAGAAAEERFDVDLVPPWVISWREYTVTNYYKTHAAEIIESRSLN
jgi:hypothetical protein